MTPTLGAVAIVAAAILSFPAVASAAPVLSTLASADCNGADVVRDEALAVREKHCEFVIDGQRISSFATARAVANPLGSLVDVTGSANTGPFAAAVFQADSSDLVTLHPPAGMPPGPVTVQAGTTYNFSIINDPPLHLAGGFVKVEVPTVNDVDLFFPPTAIHEEERAGSFSGSILTDPFTILACPCHFVVEITARGGAVNGGFIVISDPFFLNLPPGWTYTLSSAPSEVPEAGTLILIGVGASVLRMRRRLSRLKAAFESAGGVG
jgi:hypothetical protein